MSDRKHWTDEMIIAEIKTVMNFLGIDRIPTFQEINDYYNDTSLTNAISKRGGSSYWAEKIGASVKPCKTRLGMEFEEKAKEILETLLNFKCELTSTKHPYDILVEDCVKIDVKVAKPTEIKGSKVYSFNLEKKHQTCDIYFAFCIDENKNIKKIYVIPAHVMKGKKQLSVGLHKSEYDVYIARFDIVSKLAHAFKRIERERVYER